MTTQCLPLTPPDCDLRDFPYMPLDVVRLRDSDISAITTGDEFRCAVLLWCASWHQVPAASLPDDDLILSQLAGFGRVVKEWLKVKDGALRGWIKCADGRLYHPTVAEKANEAWESKLAYRRKKEADRLRKSEGRVKKKATSVQRTEDESPADDLNLSDGQAEKVPRTSDVNPAENALIGKGKGRVINKEIHTAAATSCPPDIHSPPPALSSRANEIVVLLRKHGAAVTHGNPSMTCWAEQGVTDEQALQALDIAKRRRDEAGSGQAINAGFLDSILHGEVLAKKSLKPSRHHGIGETDFREGVSDDGHF